MLIHLYESVINEDDTRSIGRIVGEVKCIGDGTPGEIRFFNTCDEIWDVRNVNNINYSKNSKILDKLDKSLLEALFNEELNITSGGGFDPETGIHSSIMKTLEPWHRKTIEYVLEYELTGTVGGKIVEP